MTGRGVRGVVVALAPLLVGAAVSGQSNSVLDDVQKDWEAGHYEAVARTLIPARERVDRRYRLTVDVLIAASLCRTPYATWRQAGLEELRNIRTNYVAARTIPETQGELLREERACRQAPVALTAAQARVLRRVTYGQGASLSVNGGKMWSLVCGYQPPYGGGAGTPPADAVLATDARLTPDTTRLPRLGLPVDRTKVMLVPALAPRGDEKPRVVTSDHFALWSVSGHSESQAARLLATLEQYLSNAVDTIGIQPLTNGVYVLLAPDPSALGGVAQQVLGVRAAGYFPYAIGASSDAVPALAAVMQPATEMPGTIAHELMHVLVHRDYPDAPLWVDEGIASLMETANVVGGHIRPLPNWRGRVLLGARRTPGELLSRLLTPGALETAMKEVEHSEATTIRDRDELFAVDRYFTLFLWERGALPRVYRDLRERTPVRLAGDRIELSRPAAKDVLAMVGRALGDRPESVEAQFEGWLRDALAKTPRELRC